MKALKGMFVILGKTMRLIWNSSKFLFIVTISMNFIVGVMTPLGLVVWREIIDIASSLLIGKGNFQELYLFLGAFFFVNLTTKIISSVSEYSTIMFSEHLDMNIKNILLSKINKFNLADFDDSETYNELSKANNESSTRSLLILQTILQIIRYGTSLFGTIILLLAFNTTIVLLCILSSVPMFYVGCKVMNKFYAIFNRRFEKLRFSRSIEALLIKNENIKEIRVYRIGNYLKDMILNIYKSNLNEDKSIRSKVTLQNIFANSISLSFEILIKIFTIFISIEKKLSIGTVTMYISSIDNLTLSITNLLSLFTNMYENTLYMKSIFILIDKKIEQKGTIQFNGIVKEIEFKNVSFHYPKNNQCVLENINLKFYANKTYALVGYNGAGKTTLIKLLLGLYTPTSGSILLNGIDIIEYDKYTLYEFVDAVFQDFIKYPFDIRSNIGIGNIDEISNFKKIKDAAKLAGIQNYIECLPNKYNTQLSREWAESTDLSLGQWQKIAIARSMMKNSSILVLDEPTAAIDVISEYEIFRNFEIMKENRLCVLVTHRLSNIRLADNIFVFDNHKIIEKGTHDELIKKKGLYKKLYELQANMFQSEKKGG